jgi:fructokinase
MNRLICFGEVLWDLFPSGPKPGGAPMNVAFHAKNLGADSYVYSAIGNDSLGNDLERLIRERQVNTSFLQRSAHPTGTVTVDISDPSSVRYTIDGPSAWDDILPTDLELNEEDTVVFGSLATRNTTTKNTLLHLLSGAAFKVFDMNLRAPFVDPETITALVGKADLLKVNEEEYAQLAQWMNLSLNPSQGYVHLNEQFGLTYLLVTYGGDGAVLHTPNDAYRSATYKITVADTVGAGDSFLAAVIYGLRNNLDTQLTMDYAAALGAMVASQTGANPIISKEDIKAFVAAQS